MQNSTAVAPSQTLLLSWRSIHHLRQVLERDAGPQAATWLQEAGFAGGEALYEAYREWLSDRYSVERPSLLDVRHLGETLSAFFSEFGWGTVQVSPINPSVIALDSSDWAEAEPGATAAFPSCHLSSGLLAEFLTRVSGTSLGVMEVECRSAGAARCRFLAGAPETLQILYSRMAEGATYLEGLGSEG
jgi:predicted hydrocarbon binding protein